MANPDSYYLRTEVSNSDLTELKNYLYPRTQYGDKEKAFKFGTLVDALITENERVHYSKRMVDDVTYSREVRVRSCHERSFKKRGKKRRVS